MKTRTDYRISSTDWAILAYGAFCGVALVYFLSGKIVLSLLLGIPPGIFAFSFVLMIHKRLGLPHAFPAHVTKRHRMLILAIVIGTGVLAFTRACIAGDGFDALLTILTFAPGIYWFMHIMNLNLSQERG